MSGGDHRHPNRFHRDRSQVGADEWSLASSLPLGNEFNAVLVDDAEQPFHFRGQVRATRANLKALGVSGNRLGCTH